MTHKSPSCCYKEAKKNFHSFGDFNYTFCFNIVSLLLCTEKLYCFKVGLESYQDFDVGAETHVYGLTISQYFLRINDRVFFIVGKNL